MAILIAIILPDILAGADVDNSMADVDDDEDDDDEACDLIVVEDVYNICLRFDSKLRFNNCMIVFSQVRFFDLFLLFYLLRTVIPRLTHYGLRSKVF